MKLKERIAPTGAVAKPDGTHTPATYVTWVEVGPASCEVLDRAVGLHRSALEPASERQVELWLAEMAVITARRRDDDGTESLRLQAYTSRLRGYPADVARAALIDTRWRWWPTWAELAEVCDRLVKPRLELQARLEMAADAERRRQAAASALVAPGQQHETREERRMSASKARAIMDELGAGLRAGLTAEEAAEADRRRRADAEASDLLRRGQRQSDSEGATA